MIGTVPIYIYIYRERERGLRRYIDNDRGNVMERRVVTICIYGYGRWSDSEYGKRMSGIP
tara:strand:+ start:1102 stop:1281 length:180 start_codon:yes stop_codon:yes gene_type:complete